MSDADNLRHSQLTIAAGHLLDALDVGDDRLDDTPARVAAAWAEWTAGYNEDPEGVLTAFEHAHSPRARSMVVQTGISFASTCAHHLAPFFGTVAIGYLPNGRVVGLSKLSRLVDIYARRLQLQEKLGSDIAEALHKGLETFGVAVVIRARHTCMETRGVRKTGTETVTSCMLGAFYENEATRNEFFALSRA